MLVQLYKHLHTLVEFRGSRTRGLAVSRKLCQKWREVRCKLAGMRQITEKQMESNGDLSEENQRRIRGSLLESEVTS